MICILANVLGEKYVRGRSGGREAQIIASVMFGDSNNFDGNGLS